MDGIKINLLQIEGLLEGEKFPANKQEIVERAKEKGVDQNVLGALEKLPDRVYSSPAEISEALGQNNKG